MMKLILLQKKKANVLKAGIHQTHFTGRTDKPVHHCVGTHLGLNEVQVQALEHVCGPRGQCLRQSWI